MLRNHFSSSIIEFLNLLFLSATLASASASVSGTCSGCQNLQETVSSCLRNQELMSAKADQREKDMTLLREELLEIKSSQKKFMDDVTNRFQDAWNRIVAENKKLSRQVDKLKYEVEHFKAVDESRTETFL